MRFDKAKAVRAAEKHLSQGKIAAAIQEYRRIVEHDPKDFAALNTLGDLYVRAEKPADAIACFTRVAEHYRTQGFTLKAIAMYKKIQRLDPTALDVADKLGTLYEQQGLIVEARQQYMLMADAYTQAGQRRKALEVLRRIADLDPQNAEIRLKLAQSYAHEGLRFDAAEAYVQAGANLLAQKAYERALDAYNQAYGLDPLNQEALSGLVSAYCGLGLAHDAAEILERAIADDPENAELRAMLVRAYLEAEEIEAAERVAKDLFARESHSYTALIEVARFYLRRGDAARAVCLLAQAIEPALAARDEETLEELLHHSLECDPEQIEALRLLVRIYTWQRDDERLHATLERLVEAAREQGLVEEEQSALAHLARLSTEEAVSNNHAPKSADEVEYTAFRLEDSASGFESEVTPDLAFGWEAVGFDSNIDGVAEIATPHLQSFEDALAPSSEVARREKLLQQELESVDYYLTQGYVDIARDTLDLLEQQFGPHASIAERRARLAQATATPADSEVECSAIPAEEVGLIEAIVAEAAPDPPQLAAEKRANGHGPTIDPGFAALLAEFRAELGEDEPAASPSDYETHYNLGVAYKEMDLLDEAIEEFQKAIALTAPQDGTPRYLQCCNLLGHCFMQKGMPRVAAMWFKRGLDAPGHSEDEYQALRYELGNAYEQMGDIERAIEVFSEVYGINVSYRGVGERLRELQSQRNLTK
jgi:tetratricopeptide (TPR) repeat protein